MYVSKYYTCEQVDQRLLQGYYDDFVMAGFAGTINEFWAFVLSIANKVNKKDGYDLSKNDFTDELKKKLDEIEEKANYITKVSQLENDSNYQTEAQVKQAISDLIDGADDALDTLKELAEALGNDPNFATTITNKLTDLRNALTEEVNRAKEEEGKLSSRIKEVNDNFIKAIDLINDKVDKVQASMIAEINRVEIKVDKNTSDIASLRTDVTGNIAEAKQYAKSLVDAEADSRRAADEKITDDIHDLSNTQTTDKAELKADIAAEAQTRTNADVVLNSKLSEEITNRQTAVAGVESKLSEEIVNRKAADESIQNDLTKEIADRTNADNNLQINIDKEAQARESADQVLKSQIDSEAATRLAQDQILDHKIEDLSSKGDSDKQDVLDSLAAETAARIAGDKSLDDKKVDKREGYSLTKNDFTDKLFDKLNGIEEKANYITKISQLLNDSGYQTQAEVEEAIQKIIGSAPEVLDTLEEIAKALGDDPNFATTITKKLAAITEKVNQEVADRTAADQVLQANLDKEVVERKEADIALEARAKDYTDNEIDKVNSDTSVITGHLATEIQDRKDADKVLQDNIDKEAADRKAADAVHDTAIVNANKRITELALSIQDAINTVKNELTAQVNANTTAIATNAANIQKNSESIAAVTKSVDDNYKEVKDMINEEIVDRTNADSSLSSRIDNTNIALGTETAERKAASEILQTNLNKEIDDRKLEVSSTKTEFDSKISNLSNTVSSEITRVEEKVTREVSDRIAGDKALGERIDSLEGTSSSGLSELKVTVAANTNAINTEKERATTRENAIQSNLDTAIANHKDEINGLTKDISDEANSRVAADAALQVNIDKEETDRKNADTLINNALAQEVADRTTAIQGIDSKKVDKVDGKGLSSNDLTDLLLVKLQGIEDKANYITKVSQLLNDSGFQTEAEVNAAIEKIIGSAPEVLNTLEEIAKALGDDPNFATTITNKLSDFEKDLAAEVTNREKGDNDLQTSLNTLSTTLNKTVEDLRTYVTETRSELMARANAQDALINQNSSNIQRNLELIQGIQNNISGSYLEVKALLETEIQARKSEDVRLEGLINQGQSDLTTETEERKAADKKLQENIEAEATLRENADKALGVRIDNEIQDRKDADTVITNNLATEVSNRTAADTALGARIDKEITDRTNADNALGVRIDNEKTAREEADKTLQDNINAEETARKAADKTLQDNIDATNAHTINGYRLDSNPVLNALDLVLTDAFNWIPSGGGGGATPPDPEFPAIGDTVQKSFEKLCWTLGYFGEFVLPGFQYSVKDLVGLDSNLDAGFEHLYKMPDLSKTNYLDGSVSVMDSVKKLDAQIKSASDGDASEIARLDARVDKEITDRKDADTTLNNNLTKTINDTKTELQGNIDTEVQARKDADSALDTKLTAAINKEVSDRTAADSALDTKLTTALNTETTERKAADTALGARVDKEITDRTTADTNLKTELTTAINTESTNRTNADKALGDRIDKEITDRANADTALGSRIDTEIQDRKDADAALKTEIGADVTAVSDALTAFKNTKGNANGLASLDANGKVPSSQLPSYVDDVIDVYATYDVSATNQISNIKLYSDAAHTKAVVGESGKSYNDVTTGNPGYQFRWSGTTWVQITSGGLIIGEITGTAYDGLKGAQNRTAISSTPVTVITELPKYTPSSKGISVVGKVVNKTGLNYGGQVATSEEVIPFASSTAAGVMSAADKVKLDTTLPNQINAEATARANADTALGNRIDKEITDRTAADNAVRDEFAADLVQETIDKDAAIKVAKDALQLNIDNEAKARAKGDDDLEKKLTPIINTEITERKAADTALGARIDKEVTDRDAAIAASEAKITPLITHEASEREKADNTLQGNITAEANSRKSEITRVEKLVSDEAAARTSADTATNTKVDSHIANKSNPHVVTKAQVGLGNVSNTSDADKPVSTAQAAAIADAKKAGTDASTALNTHIANKSNPHNVTRDQLGLGANTAVAFNKVSAPSGLWKESDERLKSFIKPLEHTLEDICSIPTDSFLIRGNHDIGTIAQAVEGTFPELVSEVQTSSQNVPNPEDFETIEKDGETYVLVKEVDYSKMSVLAIEGIKLLKQEIEELKKLLIIK